MIHNVQTPNGKRDPSAIGCAISRSDISDMKCFRDYVLVLNRLESNVWNYWEIKNWRLMKKIELEWAHVKRRRKKNVMSCHPHLVSIQFQFDVLFYDSFRWGMQNGFFVENNIERSRQTIECTLSGKHAEHCVLWIYSKSFLSHFQQFLNLLSIICFFFVCSSFNVAEWMLATTQPQRHKILFEIVVSCILATHGDKQKDSTFTGCIVEHQFGLCSHFWADLSNSGYTSCTLYWNRIIIVMKHSFVNAFWLCHSKHNISSPSLGSTHSLGGLCVNFIKDRWQIV